MKLLTSSRRPYTTGLILVFSALMLVAGSAAVASEKVGFRVFTPRKNDLTGADGSGFIVALRFKFPGDLDSTGITIPSSNPDPEPEPEPAPETTAGLETIVKADVSAASAGSGANPNFPGLIVLLSNNKSGPGHNLAINFTQIGVSHRKYEEETEGEGGSENEDEAATTGTHIWTSWLVEGDQFGTSGEIERATLLVALVEGDAPDLVEDLNDDGKLTRKDLKLMGYTILSKKVERVPFDVNGF